MYMVRNLTKNVLLVNNNKTLNGKTLRGVNLDSLMNMNEDASGFIRKIVPVALRINVFIISIDDGKSAKVRIFK